MTAVGLAFLSIRYFLKYFQLCFKNIVHLIEIWIRMLILSLLEYQFYLKWGNVNPEKRHFKNGAININYFLTIEMFSMFQYPLVKTTGFHFKSKILGEIHLAVFCLLLKWKLVGYILVLLFPSISSFFLKSNNRFGY